MEEKKKRIVGFVMFGITAVALILAIVGLCLPVVADTNENGTGKNSYGLFADEWKMITEMTKASPTLTTVGFVVAIVGLVAVIAYFVLKLFVKKNIRIVGILSALVTLAGGVIIIVGGVMIASRMNTFAGGNALVFDPGIGIWLGGLSAIVAAIAGFAAVSKRLN